MRRRQLRSGVEIVCRNLKWVLPNHTLMISLASNMGTVDYVHQDKTGFKCYSKILLFMKAVPNAETTAVAFFALLVIA